jgi:tRNA-dihydrouridine synthase
MTRKVNDVGGLPGKAIDTHDHKLTDNERTIDALCMLLTTGPNKLFTVDSMRRMQENNTEEDYHTITYYHRWIRAIKDLLVEGNVLTEQEINDRILEIRNRRR